MPSTTSPSGLTPDQLSTFNRDGYLIIPGALPKEKVAELLKETRDMLEGFSLEDHPMTKFTTGEEGGKDGGEHVGDRYFLESGDKVRFFFEEGKFEGKGFFFSRWGGWKGRGREAEERWGDLRGRGRATIVDSMMRFAMGINDSNISTSKN
jgi:hypothetical protein